MRSLIKSVRLTIVELGFLLETAWRWWLKEMSKMTPKRWDGLSVVTAELSDEEFLFVREGKTGRHVINAPEAGGFVTFRIGGDEVLRRTLRLPISARFKLRKILFNDLERQSPLDAREVLFTYRILAVERATARLVVSLTLIRRDIVEAAISRLRELGISVGQICASDPLRGGEDRFEPPGPRTTRIGGDRRRLTALFALLAIIFLLTDLGLRIERQETAIAELNSEVSQLQETTAHVEGVHDAVLQAAERAKFLAAQRAAPSLGAILAAITRLLPDGTWLTTLNFDGRNIEIQGYSTNASSLVAIFDASTLFTDAAFRAPMTQGPQPNLQQFDMSMTLYGGPS